MGPVWACPYVLDRMGPIWILYGRPHMGNSYTFHTWPIWDCYLGHTWVHYWRVYMRLSALDTYGRAGPSHKGPILACYLGPTWVYYMGLAEWDPYGSYKGVHIWASPYTSHTGLIWAFYLGPTWVLYGSAHMGLTVCEPYGLAHMGKLVYIPH